MLEAKAKDQGHERKCSPPLHKNFSRIFTKHKIFLAILSTISVLEAKDVLEDSTLLIYRSDYIVSRTKSTVREQTDREPTDRQK